MSDRPKYEVVLYNDAAIAVGAWVEGIAYAPYDGYLVAVAVKGAGIEDFQIRTSAGDPIQHCPGRDIAVDADTLNQLTNGGDLSVFAADFCLFNQAIQKNTRIDINYPNGTGTAEANVYLVFSREPFGDGRYRYWDAAEDTAAAGSIIMECPTAIPGISQVESVFLRGAGGQDLHMQWGTSGPISCLTARAVAVDTDAEPWVMFPVFLPIPDRLIVNGYNGFSGLFMTYVCYV